MIQAELRGRRLVLTVETEDDEAPIEPFCIDPIPASIGRQFAAGYLGVLEALDLTILHEFEPDFPVQFDLGEAMISAFGAENYKRLDELRQEEGEQLMQAAFFWNTVTGMDGVTAILEGGAEGVGKALALFRSRMAHLLLRIRLRMESASQTQQGDTPDTSTRPGGKKPAAKQPRQPADRKPQSRTSKPKPPSSSTASKS